MSSSALLSSPFPATDTQSRNELFSTLEVINSEAADATKRDGFANSSFGMTAKLTPEVPALSSSQPS